MVTYNGTISSCTKLFRVGPNTVVAVCGWARHIAPLIEWVRAKFPDGHPAIDIVEDMEHGSMLIVADEDGCRQYSSRYPRWIEDPYDAWGSGMDFALGAMHAGADARRAIEIATELDTGTGRGIDAVDVRVRA